MAVETGQVCMCVYVCMRVFVCVFALVCVRLCVVCLCLFACARVHMRVHVHVITGQFTHTQAPICPVRPLSKPRLKAIHADCHMVIATSQAFFDALCVYACVYVCVCECVCLCVCVCSLCSIIKPHTGRFTRTNY